VLSLKLKRLDEDNEKRRAVAARYCQGIKNPDIILPQGTQSPAHVVHIFAIRSAHRNALIEHLERHGIQTVIHYPIPPHKQQAYKEWNDLSFPITEQIHHEVLSLPMSPVLTEKEIDTIINVIKNY